MTRFTDSPYERMMTRRPEGRRLIKLWAWDAFAAAMISSSVASGFPIMILSRIVPFLSHVS